MDANAEPIHRSSVAVKEEWALLMGWNYEGSDLRPIPDWIAEARECEGAHPGLVVLAARGCGADPEVIGTPLARIEGVYV